MKKAFSVITHYLIIAIDIAIIGYLYVAMTSFNSPVADTRICKDLKISIEAGIVEGFMDEGEVRDLLRREGLYPVGKPMRDIDIRAIEEALNADPLLDDVECYKSQGGYICISMRQYIPVLRIMASDGSDYYIDDYGRIAEQHKYATKLAVATGVITPEYASEKLAPLGSLLVRDAFWQAQIEQICVLEDGTIEITPRVGDHVIYLGEPVNVAEKLDRLEKFYKFGLNKVGWGKYSRISLDIENQIICKRIKN